MARLYACIVSNGNRDTVVSVAQQFAYGIELLDDAVLLDVSGTNYIFGPPAEIAQSIHQKLRDKNISANVCVAHNAAAALLHARNHSGISIIDERKSADLPLTDLAIDQDTKEVFQTLGLKNISDLNRIGEADLISRYGREFRDIADLAKNKGKHVLTSNIKENKVNWRSELEFSVDDFSQLLFLLSNGLEKVLAKALYNGFSTEQINISLGLRDKSKKEYSIKLSFPTLEKKFWLIIINLRIANDPPEAEIVSINLSAYLAHPRSVQRGLFASAKPEPEALQLTADKIKNIVGAENVGVPLLLDRRVPKPFMLDANELPTGTENLSCASPAPVLAMQYFEPPLEAEVSINRKKLLHLRTRHFEGRVREYGGVWKGSSQWWNARRWRNQEWDVELEDQSLYRLQQNGKKWLVIGKYD